MAIINVSDEMKGLIRIILIVVCMSLVVWNVYKFDVNRKEISTQQFAKDLCALADKDTEAINAQDYDYDYYAQINEFEVTRDYVEENAIARALMNLLQISFLLFVVSILYPKEATN